jgi:capsid assembly protease
MSRHIALAAMERLSGSYALIDPAAVSQVGRNLNELASAIPEREQAAFLERTDQMMQTYGFRGSVRDKPFAFSNGVAVIPIHGTLLNRFNYSWSFATGYNFIRWQLNAALDDDDVETIVLDVNSPGGEVAGCFELAGDIYAARSLKPILAVVDALSASAAYMLSSAASKIYLTPSGRAGSIGVIAMHVDESAMLKEWGLKVTLIFAGKHKADGNPFEPLPDDVKADVQASVDKAYGQFVDLVARNRGLDSQTIRDTEARVYRADDALEEKLVDQIKTPSEAVAAFLGELGEDDFADNEDEHNMTEKTAAPVATAAAAPAPAPVIDQAAISAAVSAALSADRARQAAIVGSEEAKGRETLAQTLALEGMEADQAKRILASAPKAAEPKAADPKKDPLSAAMAATEQPEVGADGEGAKGEVTSADAAASILKDFGAATGRKVAA